jgi:hypothetical protein
MGKRGWCLGLTTLQPSRADCLEVWEPQLLENSGPVQACLGNALPLPFTYIFYSKVTCMKSLRPFVVGECCHTHSFFIAGLSGFAKLEDRWCTETDGGRTRDFAKVRFT